MERAAHSAQLRRVFAPRPVGEAAVHAGIVRPLEARLLAAVGNVLAEGAARLRSVLLRRGSSRGSSDENGDPRPRRLPAVAAMRRGWYEVLA